MEVSKSFIENISEMCNEPSWLKDHRLKSLEAFKSMPIEQSQMFFKYVSDEARFNFSDVNFDYRFLMMDEADISLNLQNCITTDSEGMKKEVKLFNKSFIFTDILSALRTHPQVKELMLGSKTEDKMEALNNSIFNSGVFIYVPINTNITIPMRSIFLINKSNSSMFNKTIVFVDEGSHLNFVEEVHSNGSTGSLYSENLEVFVRQNATANLIFLQNSDNETDNFINRKIFSNGKTSTVASNLGGRFTRYRIESYLNYDGAEVINNELFFGNYQQKFDMFSKLTHMAPNTHGKVVSKALLKGKSEALFKGIIKILKEAKNTQAYLSEHSIMLDKECKSNSIPSLEIETDSVKATHSASTQQMDAEQIFYLMSRGLTEEQARKSIALGFIEPFLKSVPSSSFKKCVESILEDRWNNVQGRVNIADMSDYVEGKDKDSNLFVGHYKYR